MKGYKGFDEDLQCMGFQYEIGKTYELKGHLIICVNGFHFCKNPVDVINFYDVRRINKHRFCEIEALGEIKTNGKKYCTNKIKIIREIPYEEFMNKINMGDNNFDGGGNIGDNNIGCFNIGSHNDGKYNVGDYNFGSFNSREGNVGSFNAGAYNIGHNNTSYYNVGDYNTGIYNVGHYNNGNFNIGNNNIGSFNIGSFNTGFFNTKDNDEYIKMFNKPTNLKINDPKFMEISSKLKNILYFIDRRDYEYIWILDTFMTKEEKARHPEYIDFGGAFLKRKVEVDVQYKWKYSVSEKEKEFIKNLPNFDANIFKEITGIDVNID